MLIGGFLALYMFSPLVNSIIESKLALEPGSDVTNAWIKPPLSPFLKIYYFNVTNAEEYLSGGKLRVQEIGPYVYEEVWEREDVEWSEDGSEVDFRMKRTYHYRPDKSSGSLTDPVILPNVPMFGMLTKMRATGPTVLQSANLFLDAHEPPQSVFEKRTVQEVTWGYNHSLVSLANLVLPEDQQLPELYGYFYGKNHTADKPFRIKTGTNDIHDLGSIVNFDNKTRLDTWFDDTNEEGVCNNIHGTDGSLYPPFVKKDQVFHIFNKDMCRSLPIEYSESVTHFEMETYRFVPGKKAFSSDDNSCFCPSGMSSCAPEGMFNVSACHGGSPMLLSWPHFYNGDPDLLQNIEGLSPDKDKHEFQVDILPLLGVGLRAAIRLQINIFLEVDGVNKLSNASDAFVPIIWFEDGIEEIDDEETISLLQSAVLKPALIQSILYPILFAVGIFVILLNISLLIRRHFNNESKNFEDLPMEARSSGY